MALIEIVNFKKAFGTKIIHENVSFYVKKGECLGLVGGSGAGKSVILRSLIGLEKPDAGTILINGVDIVPMNEQELIPIRKQVAYAFQGGALFDSMTVYENLAYPLRAHTELGEAEIAEKIYQQLTEFGLEKSIHLYPSELSGGMQKRIGLARAVIMQPEIILYDEPTAGLDPYNTKKIQDLILRLKAKGATAILVTHDIPTAMAVCDKFAFLKDKVVAEQGTIDQLTKRDNSLIQQFIEGNIL